MDANTQSVLQDQVWSLATWAALIIAIGTFYHYVLERPKWSKTAPKLWVPDNWPIAGALRFYSQRHDMYREAQQSTKTGNFGFYVGKKQVVGLNGLDGRKTFFDSRELNMNQGFAELYAGQPQQPSHGINNFDQFFVRAITHMMKKENFVQNLKLLTGDARRLCDSFNAGPKTGQDWTVIDIFDTMYHAVYQLSMRAIGAHEIADDPKLLEYTLDVFDLFESHTSTAKIFFPWLPTPNHLLRLYNGAKLYKTFSDIIQKRKKSAERPNDALQYLIDSGTPLVDIITFEIGALFAGQINSGIHAAYVPIYWATSPEWKIKVQAEVDSVIAANRTNPSQSPADVLDTLTIDQWETSFKLIDLSLRESIRIGMPGTGFRKNTSGRDIAIGSTGEVIPAGAFAAFLVDNVHMDQSIYPEPLRFDPGRYLEGRAEDKKQPHAYLGWGSGRHPCLGQRFAKLEMSMISAYLVAMYDFDMSDAEGNRVAGPPPPVNRNSNQIYKPVQPVHLRLKPRTL